MSTLDTLSTSDTPASTLISKFNSNFSALNTDKMEKSGGTFTGDIIVPDEAYGVGWNGSLEAPTKNAIYDKIEALPALSDGDKGDITVSSGNMTIDNNAVTNAKLATVDTATFKGRSTVGTGNVEDLTATQATALLNEFSSSAKGLVPAYSSGAKVLTSNGWLYANPIIYKTVTTVTKSNYTGYSTATHSVTISGGVIASGKGLRIRMGVYSLHAGFNDFRDDNAIKIELGGTSLLSGPYVITSRNAVPAGYYSSFEAIILGTGSAAQTTSFQCLGFLPATKNSTTIDTSSDITLSIYAGFESASLSISTDIYTVTIEAI